jgi:hypothetical protein
MDRTRRDRFANSMEPPGLKVSAPGQRHLGLGCLVAMELAGTA